MEEYQDPDEGDLPPVEKNYENIYSHSFFFFESLIYMNIWR